VCQPMIHSKVDVLIVTHLVVWLQCVAMSTQTYRESSGADLGRVVRDARSERGLTQQQVIEQLGLNFDRSRLARIEAGEGFQSLDRALSVLRRLGVEMIAIIPTTDASG
jgi:ribosome-binding protein aMBF1 (putative translation factor)